MNCLNLQRLQAPVRKLSTVSYSRVNVRQVVLDGVLEVARGVAEAAVVPALMMGPAGYRTILDKVIDVTPH